MTEPHFKRDGALGIADSGSSMNRMQCLADHSLFAGANAPLVSICVPAHNASRTIRTTLDSLVCQHYPNIEIIVCDNNSVDDTADIVRSYVQPNVQYVRFAGAVDNSGGSTQTAPAEENWNYALNQARGEFIALYHADDIYDPCIVCEQVRLFREQPNISAVFTTCRFIDEDGRTTRIQDFCLPRELQGQVQHQFSELFHAILVYGNVLITPTMLTRRATLETVGQFDYANFRSAADLDLWLRMASWKPIAIIEKPLHSYRLSPLQTGAQLNSARVEIADFFRVIDHFLSTSGLASVVGQEAIGFYEMERAADHILCAMNLLSQGDIAKARQHLFLAVTLKSLLVAYRRPRRLARFIVGMVMLISIFLGQGSSFGVWLRNSYMKDLDKRRKPV